MHPSIRRPSVHTSSINPSFYNINRLNPSTNPSRTVPQTRCKPVFRIVLEMLEQYASPLMYWRDSRFKTRPTCLPFMCWRGLDKHTRSAISRKQNHHTRGAEAEGCRLESNMRSMNWNLQSRLPEHAHTLGPPRGLSIPNTSRHSITCAVPLRVTKPAGIWRGLPNPRTNRHSTTRSPIIILGAATAASPALIALCMKRYLVSCQIPRANQPDENPPVNMGQPDGQPLDIMSCNLTTT